MKMCPSLRHKRFLDRQRKSPVLRKQEWNIDGTEWQVECRKKHCRGNSTLDSDQAGVEHQ
jgi:hypothetical protein